MTRRLTLLLILALAVGAGAQVARVARSPSACDFNKDTSWTPSGFVSGDSLKFDGTTTANYTMTANSTPWWLKIYTYATGTLKFNGHKVTTGTTAIGDTAFYWNGAGTFNTNTLGDSLSVGNGRVIIPTTGTLTNPSKLVFTRTGTGFTKATNTSVDFAQYVGAPAACIDSMTVTRIIPFAAGWPVIKWGTGSVVLVGTNDAQPTFSGVVLVNNATSVTGTGIFRLYLNAANINVLMPALSSTTITDQIEFGGYLYDTCTLTGQQHAATVNIYSTGGGAGQVFIANVYGVTSLGVLTYGANSSGPINSYWGTGKDTSGSFARSAGTGNDSMFCQAMQWVNKGSFSQATSTHLYTNWTSGTVSQENTADAIITSNKQSFYNLTLKATATKRVTPADSTTILGNFTVTSGALQPNGFSLYFGIDATFGGADSLNRLSKKSSMFFKGGTFTYSNSAPALTRLDSVTFVLNGNETFNSTANITNWRNIQGAGHTYLYPALKKWTFLGNVAGDFGGTTVNHTIMGSNSAGNHDSLYFTNATASPYTDASDLVALNMPFIDTGCTGADHGRNLGHTGNVEFASVWPSGFHHYYTTPYQPTVASCSPATGPATGLAVDTIIGTHFVEPCSTKCEGPWTVATIYDSTRILVTRPAHAAGAVSDTVKTPEGTVYGAGFTYVSAPVISSLKHPGGWTGYIDTVQGTYFYSSPGSVKMDTATCVTTFWTDAAIGFAVPAHPDSGNYNIYVQNMYGYLDTTTIRKLNPKIIVGQP